MMVLMVNARIKTAIVAVQTRQHIRSSFVNPKRAIVAIRTRECPKEVSLSKHRKGHIFVYSQGGRFGPWGASDRNYDPKDTVESNIKSRKRGWTQRGILNSAFESDAQCRGDARGLWRREWFFWTMVYGYVFSLCYKT